MEQRRAEPHTEHHVMLLLKTGIGIDCGENLIDGMGIGNFLPKSRLDSPITDLAFLPVRFRRGLDGLPSVKDKFMNLVERGAADGLVDFYLEFIYNYSNKGGIACEYG